MTMVMPFSKHLREHNKMIPNIRSRFRAMYGGVDNKSF
jgi:hypothetical protein